jgi:hypothetical protein
MSTRSSRVAFPTLPPVRRNQRDQTSIFIIVSGFDSIGQFFTEQTATTNVSENGCCFRLHRDVAFDALLAIQVADAASDVRARPALYQVAWMERMIKGSLIGVARLHGDPNWCQAMPHSDLAIRKA